MTRQYTIDLLARRTDSIEPCIDCKLKYKCDGERLACDQFKFFVDTGRLPNARDRFPTRAIYIDLFHKEPTMTRRAETT
jgi:hypothetical protein